MKAIETHYAGCRFRSRLEARWAVFFDALGVKWSYEEQGLETRDGERWLPDFHLPNCGMRPEGLFVEVKGAPNELSTAMPRLQKFARRLDILILQDVPEVDTRPPLHPILTQLLFDQSPMALASIVVENTRSEFEFIQTLAETPPGDARYLGGLLMHPSVRNAYLQARGARFEHGESGPVQIGQVRPFSDRDATDGRSQA